MLLNILEIFCFLDGRGLDFKLWLDSSLATLQTNAFKDEKELLYFILRRFLCVVLELTIIM